MNRSKLNIKALFVIILTIGLNFVATSCKDDDNQSDLIDPELDITKYQASITGVSDKSNLNNPEDIEVSFEGGMEINEIEEYRLILLKSESEITSNSAKDLEESRYKAFTASVEDPSQNTYFGSLNASQLDSDGEQIQLETDYELVILTKGQFNDSTIYVLSDRSPVFQLLDLPFVTTLSSNSGANDGISVDDEGNIYVCNYGQYNQSTNSGTGEEVIKITPEGTISTFVDGLVGPVGGVISSSGDYYVNSGSNFATGQLIKVEEDNSKSTLATLRGYPSGILIGTDDNLYVANYWLPIIHKVTQEGDTSVFASDSRLKGGVGIVYGNNEDIIVGNLDTGEILAVDTDGTVSSIAQVPSTVGYITYFEDHVYATGGSANKIYKISLDGNFEAYAGTGAVASTDAALNEATFNNPNGITIDKNERVLYVSEISGALRVVPIK